MRESRVEKDVCQWARMNGILPIKFTPMGEPGWPDRVFLFKGRSVFIEFKAPGKGLRPLQAHRVQILKDQEFIAEVHSDVDTAIKALHAAFFPGSGH